MYRNLYKYPNSLFLPDIRLLNLNKKDKKQKDFILFLVFRSEFLYEQLGTSIS